MFALFRRKGPPPTAASPQPAAAHHGLIRPEPPAVLLDTPRRKRLLEHIWQRTSLSRKQFAALYTVPIERYAALVQQFPASESHHHAYPGGMLDHGLEIVAYALKLRQSHLLPAGSTPEDQVAQSEAWTAAVAYGALLHDIGKVAIDLDVVYGDGVPWHPWQGPLQRPYRFRYRPDREYRLHSAATGLLYNRLLDPSILDWLCAYPAVWSAMLYLLAGQYEHAGVLGELVRRADQASVAQALGGDPTRALAAPKHALQRKLLEGLRYLLKEALKLNQPQASDGWLTEHDLWLVSKTVSDKLRAHLLAQGIDGIPASNTAVFTVLQDHGMLQPTPDGKAIWRATVTSATGWSHTFTLLRLAPALIWEPDQRPPPFAGTVVVEQDSTASADAIPRAETSGTASTSTTAPTPPAHPPSVKTEAATAPAGDSVDALLQLLTPQQALSTPADPTSQPPEQDRLPQPPGPSTQTDPSPPAASTEPVSGGDDSLSGKHFLTWLRNRVQTRKLIVNDAKALVHTTDGTAFLVSPGVFQRYAQEHPKAALLAKQDNLQDWQWVQKRFEKLGLHRKQPSGLNIWTCRVEGPRKSRRLHGYLLDDPTRLFHEVPPDNPYVVLAQNGKMPDGAQADAS